MCPFIFLGIVFVGLGLIFMKVESTDFQLIGKIANVIGVFILVMTLFSIYLEVNVLTSNRDLTELSIEQEYLDAKLSVASKFDNSDKVVFISELKEFNLKVADEISSKKDGEILIKAYDLAEVSNKIFEQGDVDSGQSNQDVTGQDG